MEWTVQELADRAGVSGRTLRHYHQIGLLAPDRIGANGYRYYGPTAVARLQRILLLRDAGLSLAAISEALAADVSPDDEITALEEHMAHLEYEQEVLGRRIASVEHTQCDRSVAKVHFRGLFGTAKDRLVTVLLGCPCLALTRRDRERVAP